MMFMHRARLFACLAAIWCLVAALPADAQQAVAPPAKTDTVSADELQRLVDSLQNEQDRARLKDLTLKLSRVFRGYPKVDDGRVVSGTDVTRRRVLTS